MKIMVSLSGCSYALAKGGEAVGSVGLLSSVLPNRNIFCTLCRPV